MVALLGPSALVALAALGSVDSCSFLRKSGESMGKTGDLGNAIPVANEEACAALCQHGARCIAYNFHTHASGCDLYSVVNSASVADANWVSAFKHSCADQEPCNMTTMQEGQPMQYHDHNIVSFVQTDTVALCAKLCLAQADCILYHYDADHAYCTTSASGRDFRAAPAGIFYDIALKLCSIGWKEDFGFERLSGHRALEASQLLSVPDVPDFQECEALCAQQIWCVGAAHSVIIGCQTYTAMGLPAADGNFDLSFKRGYETSSDCAFHRTPGRHLQVRTDLAVRVPLGSFEHCEAMCSAHKDCVAGVFKSDDKTCWISSSVEPSELTDPIYTSFTKLHCRGKEDRPREDRCSWELSSLSGFFVHRLDFVKWAEVGSGEECQRACLASDRCFTNVYGTVEGRLRCYLGPGTSAPGYEQNSVYRSALLAFCADTAPQANDKKCRGTIDRTTCSYALREGGHPQYRNDFMREIAVSGRRQCADMCDAYGPHCILYLLFRDTEGSAEKFVCALTKSLHQPAEWQDNVKFTSGYKGACGPAASRLCRFSRNEARGTFTAKAVAVPAAPVADEEACQDMCEAGGEECAAYEYRQEKGSPAKTCAQLSSVDMAEAAFVPDGPETITTIGFKSFCSHKVGARVYNVQPESELGAPGDVGALLSSVPVGGERDCEAMCNVFAERCRGFVLQTPDDGLALCQLFEAHSQVHIVTYSGSGSQSVHLRATERANFVMRVGVGLGNEALILGSVTEASTWHCCLACLRKGACLAVDYQESSGACRLLGKKPAMSEDGDFVSDGNGDKQLLTKESAWSVLRLTVHSMLLCL